MGEFQASWPRHLTEPNLGAFGLVWYALRPFLTVYPPYAIQALQRIS